MTNREMERALKVFFTEIAGSSASQQRIVNELTSKYDSFNVQLRCDYIDGRQSFVAEVRDGVFNNHERVVRAMSLNAVYTYKNLDKVRALLEGQQFVKEFRRILKIEDNIKAIETEVYIYRLLGLDLSDKDVKDFFTAFVVSLYLLTLAEKGKLKERIMEGVYKPTINDLCMGYLRRINREATLAELPMGFDIFVLENIYTSSEYNESLFELDDEVDFLNELAVALADNFRLITNDSVIKRLRTELTKLKNKQSSPVTVVDTKSKEELKKVNAELLALKNDYDKLIKTFEDITQRNFGLDQENYKLKDLVATFKETATEDEYLEHEIEALDAVEEIDLSKYKIVLIAHDALERKFKYDVYDYIKQPSRLNRLLSCDIVGIVIQCCKHKQTIAVVDFCKKMNIHYCYIDDRNQDMVDDTLKHYIKYRM